MQSCVWSLRLCSSRIAVPAETCASHVNSAERRGISKSHIVAPYRCSSTNTTAMDLRVSVWCGGHLPCPFQLGEVVGLVSRVTPHAAMLCTTWISLDNRCFRTVGASNSCAPAICMLHTGSVVVIAAPWNQTMRRTAQWHAYSIAIGWDRRAYIQPPGLIQLRLMHHHKHHKGHQSIIQRSKSIDTLHAHYTTVHHTSTLLLLSLHQSASCR